MPRACPEVEAVGGSVRFWRVAVRMCHGRFGTSSRKNRIGNLRRRPPRKPNGKGKRPTFPIDLKELLLVAEVLAPSTATHDHHKKRKLYLEAGVRAMERGIVSAGRDQTTGDHHAPRLELVRLTFPRRVYTQAHCDVTVEAVEEVYARRHTVKGLRMVHEPKYLRFFQARFEPLV